jgi:hypothetical protein
VSQTRIKKRIPAFDIVEFFEGATTERGEKVYKTMRVTLKPLIGFPITKVLTCDQGIGITEEWIEDTIKGVFEALDKDYPMDQFKLVRHKPNDVSFEYAGTKGVVQ